MVGRNGRLDLAFDLNELAGLTPKISHYEPAFTAT